MSFSKEEIKDLLYNDIINVMDNVDAKPSMMKKCLEEVLAENDWSDN